MNNNNATLHQRVGEAIKLRREELKQTQTELGKRAGMSQIKISEIENGKGNITLDTLVRIATAVECEVEIELRR